MAISRQERDERKPNMDPALNDILNVATRHSQGMKLAIESNSLKDALKHINLLLSELRTSSLNPRQYYELYMVAFDALQHLSSFLEDSRADKNAQSLSDLYELVQYAGNILPRLYLMITVGCVYIKDTDAPVLEIMDDLIDMCRGMQHPIRGLFLRYYLYGQMKDLLATEVEETKKGSLANSVSFVLRNFTEMNKLWVRFQHQGPSSEYNIREKQRSELKTIIGTNLVRISQFENMDAKFYASNVLPLILEQVVYCRDKIAQEYIMEVVIQAFSDEFHLATIDQLLEATNNLVPEADVKQVLKCILNRMCLYIASDQNVPTDIALSETLKKCVLIDPKDLTELKNGSSSDNTDTKTQIDIVSALWSFTQQILEKRPSITCEDAIEMLSGICKLSLQAFGDNMDYLDRIYESAYHQHQRKVSEEGVAESKSLINCVRDFLNLPMQSLDSPFQISNIEHYILFLSVQSRNIKQQTAHTFLNTVLQISKPIQSVDETNLIINISKFIIEEESTTNDYYSSLLSKVIHLIRHDDPQIEFTMLSLILDNLNVTKDKLCYITLTIVTKLQMLSLRIRTDDSKRDLLSQIIRHVYTTLCDMDNPNISVRCLLSVAQTCDACNLSELTYEYLAQAFVIFEESIADSKSQYRILVMFINTLFNITILEKENYTTIASKIVKWSSRLLKKQDQARLLYLSSHLYWQKDFRGNAKSTNRFCMRDAEKLLECMQKSFKIADGCLEDFVVQETYIEILNRYILHFDAGIDPIVARYINNLIELIRQGLKAFDTTKAVSAKSALQAFSASSIVDAACEEPRFTYLNRHFESTISAIRKRRIDDPKWKDILV